MPGGARAFGIISSEAAAALAPYPSPSHMSMSSLTSSLSGPAADLYRVTSGAAVGGPSLQLHLSSYPQFLFPTPPAPRFRPPTDTSPYPSSPEPRDDTVVNGHVVATVSRSTPIKGLRVVWEVGYQTRLTPNEQWAPRGSWVARQVDVMVGTDFTDTGQETEELWLESGHSRFDFTFILPATLPPTTRTPLSRVTHTVYASVLAPTTSCESRRSSMHVSSPPYSPAPLPEKLASHRRASLSSIRSRADRRVSFDPARPSPQHFLPDLSSPLGLSTPGLSRSSSCSSCCSDSVSSMDLAVDDSDLPLHSSGGLMLEGTDTSVPGTAFDSRRSSFDFFRLKKHASGGRSIRTTSSTQTREIPQSQPPTSPPTLLQSILRIGSPTASGSDAGAGRHSSPRPPLAIASSRKTDRLLSPNIPDCPSICLPTLALASHEVEIHAVAPFRGLLPRMEWSCEEHLPGLGPVAIQSSSGLFALGSAFNFKMHLAELQPTITIHFITISLVQYHNGAGSEANPENSTAFMLHKAGTLRRKGRNGRPTDGGYIWRGALGQALEAAEMPKVGSPKKRKAPLPPTVAPSKPEAGIGAYATDSSFTLSLPLRLPSPVVGAAPGTPTASVLPAGTERTLHKLCVELFFSAIGEDELGKPYPDPGPDRLGSQRREGGLRKCIIQRQVEVAPCSATPCNLVLPPYDPAHANMPSVERPDAVPCSVRQVTLANPRTIQLMPKTAVPAVFPSHHLSSGVPGDHDGGSLSRSCLCFWEDGDLEKHVGPYVGAGRWVCPASRRKTV